MRIAAILTAYNRCEKTLACLYSLRRQEIAPDVRIEIFLTDDASPDGTATAVRAAFPDITIVPGTGDLFWDGGMRLAFGEALRRDFDAYLWLNDDTVLASDAIPRLLRAQSELRARREANAIIVGATCDPVTGAATYGGVVRSSRVHPLKFKLLMPCDLPLRCDTFNGNCVLIPREAAALTGNISDGFTHIMGDFDYGLRARRLGCSIWVVPGFVATSTRNPVAGNWLDVSLPLRERWRMVCGPKGLPPLEYRRFAARHGGALWPLYWAMPYGRLLLSGILKRRFRASNVNSRSGQTRLEKLP